MSEDRATVLVRLPKDLKRRLQAQAKEQGVSLNQMITYSLSRDVAQLEAQSYFDRRLEGKSPEEIKRKFSAVMDKIQDRSVPDWDRK